VSVIYREIRQRYFAAKKIRQLKKLRTHTTAAGYTLRSFDQYRCIFVHIPKCAGVSVCQSLFANLGAGHYPLTTYLKVFSNAEYAQYFKFTIVRNPWDRLLSAYLFLKQGGYNSADRRWGDQYLGVYDNFGDFVRNWVTPDNIRAWVHFLPQTDYLRAPDGATGMDFIGRFENLEADFGQICDRLGIAGRLDKLNIGRGENRSYSEFYDNETRELVAEAYREDIVQLGYRFAGQ
jgi:hypothetical protein